VTGVTVVPGRELDDDVARRWSALQRADDTLASPFLGPQYTRAVAGVRGDVFVALLDGPGDARVAGVLAFQRSRRTRIGRPVGRHLSDYQAAIVARGLDWDPRTVVRASGLRAWDFDHLVATQEPLRPFHVRQAVSPYLDVTGGFAAYRARHAGSRHIRDLERRGRRLSEDVGPLRFTAHDPDVALLHRVLAMKSAQYRRTGARDVFADRWAVEVVERIHATQDEDFAGMLSALWAGDRLVAAHAGLRSRTVWHWWFPVYNPGLGCYSPGLLLVLEMARAAEALGIRTIDLGKGSAPYKERLMTGAVPLAVGSVGATSGLRAWRRGSRAAREAIRRTPLGRPAVRLQAALRSMVSRVQ
jgi:CelD/BcsL family acetyltransferase involved in cellulose biosynthesis